MDRTGPDAAAQSAKPWGRTRPQADACRFVLIRSDAVVREIVALREHDFLSHVEDARKVLTFNRTTDIDHKS
jgi:hypothetical protein